MNERKLKSTPNSLEVGFERVISPFQEFIHNQATGSLLLIMSTVVALITANSPFAHDYEALLSTRLGFVMGDLSLQMSLHHWINDGLMALFFFLLGLEIKREILVGELKQPKYSILVIIAAIGGMIMPATIYLAFNHDTSSFPGWGIPMATDTAFAVGILVLLKKYIPNNLITFLTALAIIDDLGAILVIALFYTKSIHLMYLGFTGFFVVVLLVVNILGIRSPLIYFFGGVFIWLSMLGSGIHATIAGIIIASVIPARPKRAPEWFVSRIRKLVSQFEHIEEKSNQPILGEKNQHLVVEQVQETAEKASTPLRRWEHHLEHPTTLFILPIFALANAGIPINTDSLLNMWTEPLSLGIIFGLLFGKSMGITLFCWIAVSLKLGVLPKGITMRHIVGLGLVAGIGFTMAIFIDNLGFASNPEVIVAAKSAIIIGSLLAGIAGGLWLRFTR